VQIHLAIHEILTDEAFTATDGLISQSFVVAFVHPAYVQIVSSSQMVDLVVLYSPFHFFIFLSIYFSISYF